MADSDHNPLGEGSTLGVIGAITVATWFLILDLLAHRPFFTPSVLGQIILLGRETPSTTLVPEAIALYSFVHFAAFIGFGILLTQLVHLAARESIFRFLLLILFVIFEFFFYAFTYVFFEGTRGIFPWWSMLAANTLAAGAMGLYIWLRHPGLRQSPDHEPLGAETN
ncbi:MAG: hypothetical protein ABI836_13640 [Gemmatimonadota bacterium]